MVTNDEEDQLRLIDDVFVKLCLLINDISVEMKVFANSSMVYVKFEKTCNFFKI